MSGSRVLRTEAPDKKLDSDWQRQLTTANAIAERHLQGFGSVLLADEVGMGKTYVALATIAQQLFRTKKNDQKALLVVPPNAVLAAKWEQEIRSFNQNYLDRSKVTKELRPIVVRDYWELIQNLHDYDSFDIGRISSGMLGCFALALWRWNDSRRKKRSHKKEWAIYGKLNIYDATYLGFCSYCSEKSMFNFLDDLISRDQTGFKGMIAALESGAMDHVYLKELIRRYADMQDSMESNVYVVSMASLRRTRSDHQDAKLLATYIAGKALKGKWGDKWEQLFKSLCKAGLCFEPGNNVASGGKRHYQWFVDLSQINLWGMQGAVERCIENIGASQILDQLLSGNPKEILKKLSDDVVKEKLSESKISLAVIDEVHNWKNGSNGADEFRRNYAPYIKNKLMMSATPFQLHQDELGKVFRFVAAPNDRSIQLVESVLQVNGSAVQCLAASAEFLESWNNLVRSDLVLLHEQLGGVSSTTDELANNLISIKSNPASSEELISFVDTVAKYRLAVTALKSELSQIIIRHTKSREKRHFHAGAEFVRSATPDYKLKRRVMNKVAGLGDEGDGALLNYLAMRVEQLVRRDINANKGQTNVHLLGGITSSLAAFKESNDEMLSNPKVSTSTLQYLDFFKTSLESAIHPKVSATVDRALYNYKAGFKTLIFCERLRTQEEVKLKIEQRIQSEVFGTRDIEEVKKDRRNLLKEYQEVELYWSRSYISAGDDVHLKQLVLTNSQMIQSEYDVVSAD